MVNARLLSDAARLALVALFALGLPVTAQGQTPRERAEGFARQAGLAVTDGERARLWFLSLAEWYEEGARAILTLDHDRLHHAVREEGRALLLAHRRSARHCPPNAVVWVPRPVSHLAYAAGQWDGGAGRHGTPPHQADLANSLLEIAEARRRDALNLCAPLHTSNKEGKQ